VRGQGHAPATLYPRERPGSHCTGGWLGPRADLDRRGKSRPHRDSIPGPSSPQPVAIPATFIMYCSLIYNEVNKFTQEQAMNAPRGSRGIALLFLTPALVGGWVVSATPRPLYPRERDTVPTGGWVGSRAGVDGIGKSRPPAPTNIRSPDRPARSQSLYRLSYWAH